MATTKYVWSSKYDNIVAETDGADAVQAIYTQEPALYGNLISQRRGSDTSYYHFDGLGSTRALTDSSQQVTDTNLYDAWGVEKASTGTTVNPFRWVGEKGYCTDSETGRLSVRERQFEPIIAVWVSLDLAGFINGLNRYLYAGNHPVLQRDPSGLWYETLSDVWIADQNDTFQQLVALVAPSLNAERNISCIRPVCLVDAADWKAKRPTVGGYYQTGNLTDSWPTGSPVVASVGADCNGYINAANIFFDVPDNEDPNLTQRGVSGSRLAELIMTNAGNGTTPIGDLQIIGHSWHNKDAIGGSRIGCTPREIRRASERTLVFPTGTNVTFDRLQLRSADPQSKFASFWSWQTDLALAQSGHMPPGCWFRSDATVRLIGCITEHFAASLARVLLRKGAAAYGTDRPTWAFPTNDPKRPFDFGWGTFQNGVWHRAANPAPVASATAYFALDGPGQPWKRKAGEN
ncbi:MAG: RHS repeat-associated core domain-containing protein [Planctomycetales bacterium]